MFIEGKYKRTYFKLVEKYGEKVEYKSKRRNGVEKHHIVPTSLGGTNELSNLVYLSPRVHYICHLLLVKMTSDDAKRKMAFAVIRMKQSKINRGININSKIYEILRREAIRTSLLGKNNPAYGKGYKWRGAKNHFWGKHHTSESIKMMKLNKPDSAGIRNPFYGKKHTKKIRRMLSELRSKPITIILISGKKMSFKSQQDAAKFIAKRNNASEAVGQKILKPQFSHLLSKYGVKKYVH